MSDGRVDRSPQALADLLARATRSSPLFSSVCSPLSSESDYLVLPFRSFSQQQQQQQQRMDSANTFLSTIGQRIRELITWAPKFDGPWSSSSASASPLPSTLRDDLEELRRTLARIEAVLYDAEEREISDTSVQLWLRELRDIAYDADQVLDECEYEVLRAKAGTPRIQDPEFASTGDERPKAEQVGDSTLTPPPLNMDVLFWGRIASTIGKIKKRFEERAEKRDALELKEDDGRRRRQNLGDHRLPTSSVIDDFEVRIQGREGDLDRLINGLLLSRECGENNLTVIPVVGMAGVGKTTLVQHVYNHADICERFKLRGWVCVSFDFDVVKLTRKIIEAFTNTACDPFTELDPLHRKLQELVKEKRFLLVLDDVWNENIPMWERLRVPLSRGGKGSAVVTTTRSAEIARFMQTTVPFHPLECLSEEHCRAIFLRFAFRGLENPGDDEELVAVGKMIADKCKGLPLAAKALGSMLRYESDVDSWKDVLHSEVWEFRDCEILPALMLSYAHLPPHLKRCFVYCSLFPKDFRFHKDELVLLWMAQGFIHRRRRKQVEDVGATYVDELMQRSLFQVYDPKHTSTFGMHDLVHDLAQYNSQGEFHRVDEFQRVEREKSFDPSYTRHLSIASTTRDIPQVLRSLMPCSATGGLRTLHLFSVSEMGGGLPSMLVSNLRGLRTLILSGQRMVELPGSIGDLKHLRYLDLSGTCISTLPETVCNLYYLQTLLLRRCRYLESLPEVILKLSNLRCLEFSRYL